MQSIVTVNSTTNVTSEALTDKNDLKCSKNKEHRIMGHVLLNLHVTKSVRVNFTQSKIHTQVCYSGVKC